MRKKLIILLPVLLTLMSLPVGGQQSMDVTETREILTIAPHEDMVDVSSYLWILEDPRGSMDLEEARQHMAEDGERWQGRGAPTFGYTSSAYWARLELQSQLNAPSEWILQSRFALLERIELYFQDQQGQWQSKVSGHGEPRSAREVNDPRPSFLVPMRPGQQQTLFVRVESYGSVQLPLRLMSQSRYQSLVQLEQLLAGGFYGVLLVLAFYCLFMWGSSHDRSYLYFSLFIISGAMYSFADQGLALQYVWPQSPEWANYLPILMAGLGGLFVMLFVREYLHVSDWRWFWRRLVQGLLLALVVAIYVSAFMPAEWASRLMLGCALMVQLAITVIVIKAVRSGRHSAWYFLSAWLVFLTGFMVEVVQRVGVPMPPLLAYHSDQVGTVVSALILSFGLSNRMNRLMVHYRSAQQDMIKANQLKLNALQRADSLKEEFVTNVSHELRTPLTGIIGLAEIMLDRRGESLHREDRETLLLMKVSAQRLATLVNDVIDFSTLKKGYLELHRTDADLKPLCHMVAQMTRPLIGGKLVELREHYPDQPVIAEVDEDRLQQVIFNLVSNAIKFTQHGYVEIRIDVIDDKARITVEDTGLGIPERDRQSIFERFYQADLAGGQPNTGTGLGLSISRQLLEMHGTRINLHSEPGKGSVFYFDLPVKDGVGQQERAALPSSVSLEEVDDKQNAMSVLFEESGDMMERRTSLDSTQTAIIHSTGSGGDRGRVLIVDDEYLNLRVVESHLAPFYEVKTASSGSEALEMISERCPDLIILDIMMPVMTGLQFCEIIRTRYEPDELPVIMLTARNRVGDQVEGFNAGANDYITKPFSKEELLVRVSKQFELLELIRVRRENQYLNWKVQRFEESQRHLKAQQHRLAGMLDITDDAMIGLDGDGIVAYMNSAAEQLLQVSQDDFSAQSINELSAYLGASSPQLAAYFRFPFDEALLSSRDELRYEPFVVNRDDDDRVVGRFCIMTLDLEQGPDCFVMTLEVADSEESGAAEERLEKASLPELIQEFNRNVERTETLTQYLRQIQPEDLKRHKELSSGLKQVDELIQQLSGKLPEKDIELQYREALVKVMQDCHFYWQKVTGESVIRLAEESRIWSVSVDNGRLRTRSMNRYLSVDKLPANPRWRQVARTAYFVLSRVSHDPEAREALDASVTRLQELVEERAMS